MCARGLLSFQSVPSLHFSKPTPVCFQSSENYEHQLKYVILLAIYSVFNVDKYQKVNTSYIFGDDVASNFNVTASNNSCISWNDRIQPKRQKQKR